MSASIERIYIEKVADPDPDASYLAPTDDMTQEERARAQARLNALERGDWEFIGIRAVAHLEIPIDADTRAMHTIASPGLWSIESDTPDDQLREIGREEIAVLEKMLAELGL